MEEPNKSFKKIDNNLMCRKILQLAYSVSISWSVAQSMQSIDG